MHWDKTPDAHYPHDSPNSNGITYEKTLGNTKLTGSISNLPLLTSLRLKRDMENDANGMHEKANGRQRRGSDSDASPRDERSARRFSGEARRHSGESRSPKGSSLAVSGLREQISINLSILSS